MTDIQALVTRLREHADQYWAETARLLDEAADDLAAQEVPATLSDAHRWELEHLLEKLKAEEVGHQNFPLIQALEAALHVGGLTREQAETRLRDLLPVEGWIGPIGCDELVPRILAALFPHDGSRRT